MIAHTAEKYVEHVDNLAQKGYTRTLARLEGVFLVRPWYQEVLETSHFFIPSMLDHLLESVPMIVLFQDNKNGLGPSPHLQPVPTNLSTTLYDLLQFKKGLGGFHNSWSAFQLVLAVEELL